MTLDDEAANHARLAGALAAISVVVAELCKTLSPDARATIRQRLTLLQENAAESGGTFAASVKETCAGFLLEL